MSEQMKPDQEAQESNEQERKAYSKPTLKNHGNLRLISQMS